MSAADGAIPTMDEISGGSVIDLIHWGVDWAAVGIEVLAIAVIVGGVLLVVVRQGTCATSSGSGGRDGGPLALEGEGVAA